MRLRPAAPETTPEDLDNILLMFGKITKDVRAAQPRGPREGEGARRRWGGWEAEMGRRIGRAQVSVEGSVRARSRCWGREKVEVPTFDQPTHSPPT